MAGELKTEHRSGRHYSPIMYAKVAWASERFPNANFAYMGVAQHAFDALLRGEMTGEDVRSLAPTPQQINAIGRLLTHHHRHAGIRKVHEGATKENMIEIHIPNKVIEVNVFDGTRDSAWALLTDLIRLTPAGGAILSDIVANRSVLKHLRRNIGNDELAIMLDRFAQDGGQWRTVVKEALHAGARVLDETPPEDILKFKRAALAERGYGYELSVHEPSKAQMAALFNSRTISAVFSTIQAMHIDPSLGFDPHRFSQVARLGN